MLKTGAQVVIDALKQEGVDTVFGYPGGQALPLYDALYDAGLNHILPRHEQGAAHAADGYARATGKVGVCISTSGPGATNLVTGIATAQMDSVPMVCITCQVGLAFLGKDSFQEADITGITTPITKHNFMIRDKAQLPRVMRKAFYIARTGRPGVVVVDIPKNILQEELEFDYPEQVSLPGYHPIEAGDPAAIAPVAELMQQAKRPILMVGGGVIASNTAHLVRQLVKKTGMPVVTTMMGIGAIPYTDNHLLGLVGMHGLYAANMAVQKSDLVIALGCRFSDRVIGKPGSFASKSKLVHFDVDPAEINKNVKADLRVVGALDWSLPLLLKQAKCGDLRPWMREIRAWQKGHPLKYGVPSSGKLMPQEVLLALNDALKGEAIVVTDVGQHQMWAAQYMSFKEPRQFLTSGGLGTMGYGLPAAMGAQIGCQDQEVWLISGDGSIMMNCQEMATVAELELPVKVVIMNNRGLGMVRQWQRFFFGNRYSYSKHKMDLDFAHLADAMGATGIRLEAGDDINAVIAEAREIPGPVFIDARVDDDENIMPMVAPGKANDNMME